MEKIRCRKSPGDCRDKDINAFVYALIADNLDTKKPPALAIRNRLDHHLPAAEVFRFVRLDVVADQNVKAVISGFLLAQSRRRDTHLKDAKNACPRNPAKRQISAGDRIARDASRFVGG